jgi:hypothetical protein
MQFDSSHSSYHLLLAPFFFPHSFLSFISLRSSAIAVVLDHKHAVLYLCTPCAYGPHRAPASLLRRCLHGSLLLHLLLPDLCVWCEPMLGCHPNRTQLHRLLRVGMCALAHGHQPGLFQRRDDFHVVQEQLQLEVLPGEQKLGCCSISFFRPFLSNVGAIVLLVKSRAPFGIHESPARMMDLPVLSVSGCRSLSARQSWPSSSPLPQTWLSRSLVSSSMPCQGSPLPLLTLIWPRSPPHLALQPDPLMPR